MLDLATALRESAVDVVLDKWDLKEGHDVVAVMERMGTDAGIEKVIMVFDRRYVEKANDWSGGVGTEAQIITSQIYERSDQGQVHWRDCGGGSRFTTHRDYTSTSATKIHTPKISISCCGGYSASRHTRSRRLENRPNS